MNLSKALKVKNRLVGELNTLRNRATENNSYLESSTTTIDRNKIFKDIEEVNLRLIAIKTAIAEATAPISNKLVCLAEAKATLEFYKSLNVREGQSSSYDYQNGQQVLVKENWKNVVSEVERQAKVKYYQDVIASVQDDIDDYNAVTIVNFTKNV